MYVNNVQKKDTIMKGGVDVKLEAPYRHETDGDVQLNTAITLVLGKELRIQINKW
jgi:hypothetical protein